MTLKEAVLKSLDGLGGMRNYLEVYEDIVTNRSEDGKTDRIVGYQGK